MIGSDTFIICKGIQRMGCGANMVGGLIAGMLVKPKEIDKEKIGL